MQQRHLTAQIFDLFKEKALYYMTFSNKISEKALLDCGRCCCLCHKFCGPKIELHHITQKAEGGEDSYENCLPLCFDCHAEVKAYNPKHPKGRKYTESELVEHRNRWYKKIESSDFSLIHPECIELDRNLFRKIIEILPIRGGSIEFVRNHCYADRWISGKHNALMIYLAQCENPDFEFIDSDLEIRRNQLTEKMNKFTSTLFAVSFDIKNWKGDHPAMAIYPDIKYSKPDIYREALDDVHQSARDICNAYDDFIRLSRRKLAIE